MQLPVVVAGDVDGEGNWVVRGRVVRVVGLHLGGALPVLRVAVFLADEGVGGLVVVEA